METIYTHNPHCHHCHEQMYLTSQVSVFYSEFHCLTCGTSLKTFSFLSSNLHVKDAKFEPDKMQTTQFFPIWNILRDDSGLKKMY